MRTAASLAFAALLAAAVPARADDLAGRIDEARQNYQKGDLVRASGQLQAVLDQIQAKLGETFIPLLPPPPAGWDADQPETDSLDIGGGLSVSRGYQKGDGALNASMVVDNPAVAAAAAMLSNPNATTVQPNFKRVRIGSEDALLRWDGAAKSGEITMVLGGRVLLQVNGSEIDKPDLLVEMAKGWNIAGIRKQTGV